MAKTPIDYNGAGMHKYNYNNQATEIKQVEAYLIDHTATSTMVATALHIYRPNLTRYKNMLQETGKLVVTHNAKCKETGYRADYLSCNLELIKRAKSIECGGKNANS